MRSFHERLGRPCEFRGRVWRDGENQFRRFLEIAMGSAVEFEYHLPPTPVVPTADR